MPGAAESEGEKIEGRLLVECELKVQCAFRRHARRHGHECCGLGCVRESTQGSNPLEERSPGTRESSENHPIMRYPGGAGLRTMTTSLAVGFLATLTSERETYIVYYDII
jgi:hypothetical protein